MTPDHLRPTHLSRLKRHKGHTLFTQVLAAQLPMQFCGNAVMDELKHLEDAGYIQVAFSHQTAQHRPVRR